MRSNQDIQEVDFLPADFKRRRTNRHQRSWQVVVGSVAIGLVVVVALVQYRAKRQIEARLSSIEPERPFLAAQASQLEKLRRQLLERESQAELFTYMDHPWPKTQLLAATLRSLPDAIVFDRIRIDSNAPPGQRAGLQGGDAAEEDLTAQPAARRDLRLLQQECDPATVTISLEGLTMEGIELYRYLDRMNDVPLFEKVELKSLESTENDSNLRFRFEAQLTVHPGYGQPNGPDNLTRRFSGTGPGAQVLAAEVGGP